MSWSCSLWTITVRFITTLSRWGHTVLRALVHYVSMQSNKAILLYFSQNSVSEIQFHVRVQRSDLALLPMLKMLLSWVSLTWNPKEHNPYSWRPPLIGKKLPVFIIAEHLISLRFQKTHHALCPNACPPLFSFLPPDSSSQPLSFHLILSSSSERVLYEHLLHADPET